MTLFRWSYQDTPVCACGATVVETSSLPLETVMIQTDDIPGGQLVEHGICHDDGTPRRCYSQSEIRRRANLAGWTIVGETPKVLQEVVDRQQGATRG